MAVLVTTDDYAATARALTRGDVWAFIEGGAGQEATLRGNEDAFGSYWIRPTALVDVSRVDTSIEVFGQRWAAPIGVAPTALHTLVHAGGESATAAAAAAVGLPLIVSAFAAHTIEDVSSASKIPELVWQQVYVFKDRAVTHDLIQRAQACGAGAIVVTVDSPWMGRRPRNLRHRFRIPPGVVAGNLAASLGAPPDISCPEKHSAEAMDPALGWDDIEKLAAWIDVPLLVKGVLTGRDARHAIDAGAAGIIVSNHGARQLDRALPTLTALPDVVEHAGGTPVLMDGGIRSGTDVAIALALGARAVLIGRPLLWGLAIGGQSGAESLLRLLMTELVEVMGQSGRPQISDITASLITQAVPAPPVPFTAAPDPMPDSHASAHTSWTIRGHGPVPPLHAR